MSAAPKVAIRNLTKAFQMRRRKNVGGVSTEGLAGLNHLLRRSVLPERMDIKPVRGSKDFLFALDDVSIDVPAGEVLGIIGRNGAGKSTLLRILARVLEPTEGRVEIRGRVVSLLDLGIGFAPELTVRENIQIYGRLAGVTVSDILAVEDRILEFSRLTKFRDAPLEYCPSGASMQLAFAAMVSFDADIILADEVLTVGDSEFREACEERIRAVGRSGESVLFVSHNMNAIRRCCTRVVWIDKGRVRQVGSTDEVVRAYTTELLAGRLESEASIEPGSGCRLLDLRLLDAQLASIGALQITEPAFIDCVFRVERPDILVTAQIELWQHKRHVLTSTIPNPIRTKQPVTFHAALRLPQDFLNDVSYRASCKIYVQEISKPGEEPTVAAEQSIDIAVMNPRPELSVWSDWTWNRGGIVSPKLQWSVDTAPTALSPSTPARTGIQ